MLDRSNEVHASVQSAEFLETPKEVGRRNFMVGGAMLLTAALVGAQMTRKEFPEQTKLKSLAAQLGFVPTGGPQDDYIKEGQGARVYLGLVSEERTVNDDLVPRDHFYLQYESEQSKWSHAYPLDEEVLLSLQANFLAGTLNGTDQLASTHDIKIEPFSDKQPKKGRILVPLESPELVLSAIQALHRELAVLPLPFIKSCAVKNLYFCERLTSSAGAKLLGAADLGEVFMTLEGISKVLPHEFFHNADLQKTSAEAKKAWDRLSNKPYGAEFTSGKTRDRGFVLPYSRKSALEDRAVIADILLDKKRVLGLVRATNTDLLAEDDTLSQKVRFLTGHNWDFAEAACLEVISEEEYSAEFEVDGYCFLPEWSQDKQGQITMNADFYNRIIAQARA